MGLWKYPLTKIFTAGAIGYSVIGAVDMIDSSAFLDDDEKWKQYRSDFYELYYKLLEVTGKRRYIEEPYRQYIPSGSYLRCAIDSLEKAHQIIGLDSNEILRRRILRKAHRYAIGAITKEQDKELRAKTHKWYGLIMMKRAKYGNREKRLKKAVNELEKAVVVDSMDPHVWHYLGVAKYELGEYQQAMDCYLRAEKLKPTECPQISYHLGLARKRLNTPGFRSDACDDFKRVLTKHCDSIVDTLARRVAIEQLRECEERSSEEI